LTLTQLQ